LTIQIDEQKIIVKIKNLSPKRVLFSAPDGLLLKAYEIANKIKKKYYIETFVSVDPCYGACDTLSYEIEKLDVDLVVHIGHNRSKNRIFKKTLFIEAFDDISFYEILNDALSLIKKYKKIGLCTISQHLHELIPSKDFLENHDIKVLIGRGNGLLEDGQILGCEFYSVYNIRDKVDAFVILGQSNFHAIGLELATGKSTFQLDPYMKKIISVSQHTEKSFKKAFLSIIKARDAERFGIIIGLKEGQMNVKKALNIKKKLEDCGKEVGIIVMREIFDDRLALLKKNIDVFIQTACPRISIDGCTFSSLVLSIPQIEALFKLWKGENIENFLRKTSWH
jgi:2-(3-amino-3-carboxypropyl)histidine synthase